MAKKQKLQVLVQFFLTQSPDTDCLHRLIRCILEVSGARKSEPAQSHITDTYFITHLITSNASAYFSSIWVPRVIARLRTKSAFM